MISHIIEILEKGKAYPVGTVRKWGGLDYMKHPEGWVVVTQGKHFGKLKGQVRSGTAQPHHVDFINQNKGKIPPQTNTNATSNVAKPSPIQTPSPEQKPQPEVKPEEKAIEKKKRGRPKKVVPAEGQPEPIKVKKERKPREKKPITKILSGQQTQPQAKPISATKSFEEMTPEEVIQSFTPKLIPSELQRPMSVEEFKNNLDKMSEDDLAWHLMNTKEKDFDEIDREVSQRIDFGASILLALQNNKISKKSRTHFAEYYIDKKGVSFVPSKGGDFFIQALASKGFIDKKVLNQSKDSSLTSDIYYGKINDPNELRKINVNEYDYQLRHNPYTPADVLEKCAKYTLKHGYASSINGNLKEIVEHPNATEEIIRKYSPDYELTNKSLWKCKNISENTKKNLIEKDYHKMSEPPAFEIDEKRLKKIWDNAKKSIKDSYAFYVDQEFSKFADYDYTPTEILKEILNYEHKSDKEGGRDLSDSKTSAYKALVKRGEITEDDIINQVGKVLKLKGDKLILKEFGERAFINADQPSQEEKTLIPIDPKELEELKKHLAETHAHENFDVEIEGAWTLDVETHKDFPKVAKEINTVKKGLFHGTSFNNAGGIISTGINVGADARTGQMFGQGFYLASESSKAAQYAGDSFSTGESSGIIFELDVSLGKVKTMKYGRPENDRLSTNIDGVKREIPEYAKKAKQLEKEGKPFSTKWHYTNDSVHAQAGVKLLYDEYVVKDPNQIHINKIIKIKKTPKKKVA